MVRYGEGGGGGGGMHWVAETLVFRKTAENFPENQWMGFRHLLHKMHSFSGKPMDSVHNHYGTVPRYIYVCVCVCVCDAQFF